MVYVEDLGRMELNGAYMEMSKMYQNENDEIAIDSTNILVIPQENGMDIRIDLRGLLTQDSEDITEDTSELNRLEKLWN